MKVKITDIVLLFFALLSCSSAFSATTVKQGTGNSGSVATQQNSETDTLVTVDWLHTHLNDPDLVILDTTVKIDFSQSGEMIVSSGRNDYEQGHIPTAGFADLTRDLVDTTSRYPYALPSPEAFAQAMNALGVDDNSRVVLYASNYSAWAARVWWMLRWIGFDNAVILDGGLSAWTAAGYPLSTETTAVDSNSKESETLSVSVRPGLIAERDEVFAAISNDEVVLIDAMPAEHFRGEMVMYGRAGHIPTAINIPGVWAEDGHFLTDDELEKLHATDRNLRTITYCGGGISASANAFAMHRIGFTDIAVYMNSLEEWAADPANPLITTGN